MTARSAAVPIAAPPFLLLPPGVAFAPAVARRLLETFHDRLPDLSGLTLVLAAPALAGGLRAALAQAGGALLGPRMLSLSAFALEALPAAAAAPLSPLACRLRLTEWLGRLRAVFPGQDPARLADALFELFESLAQNASRMPDDEATFTEQLAAAYAAPPLAALSREAEIVHRLWRAYVEEIGPRAPAVAQLLGLEAALAQTADTLLLGFDGFGRAPARLIGEALSAGRVSLWTTGRLDGRDGAALRALQARLGVPATTIPADGTPAHAARSGLFNALLDERELPARDRAAAIAGRGEIGIRLVAAGSDEHEARIVDLAVRKALLAGAQRVVVVSSDRRLARRLRALLERANVGLDDQIGWALATSRAAAAMSSWLECIETDFHYRPLLDLLKTGFFAGEPAERPEPALAARLERALTARRQDGRPPPVSGLAAFATLLEGRYAALFERLRRAAAMIAVAAPARAAGDWAGAVLDSLAGAGLAGGLAGDDAGSQVMATLHQLQAALVDVPLRLRWPEFRALLDRHLEEATFRPAIAADGPRVLLSTLDRIQGLDCDALILASATRAQLPGSAPGEVFFNQSVRRELGLDGWDTRQALALTRLRALLEAAPRVIVTYAAGSEGEPPQPSPWLEALAAFAAAAGFDPLHDTALAARALRAEVGIDAVDPPAAAPATRPAPAAAPALLPTLLGASSHQALIDCPYRWHAQRLLRLAAPEAPDAPATGRDYGDRVHAILRAFHQHHDPALPPPYRGPLDATATQPVIDHLARIADAVFAADLAARPLARIWRREFDAVAPWLAERLIAGGRAASVLVELDAPRPRAGWTLGGRIDRLEVHADGEHVIDYKTGRSVPGVAEIESGEAVQLPHYALSRDQVSRLEYWKLREDEPRKRIQALTEPALTPLLDALEARLAQLRADLDAAHPLPAHGDEATCAWCEFDGLCRRGAWAAP